ncbi:type II toxin-antitoxin system MqsA family antitoxin [Aromatoleum bremense]|uniref:YgiT-type zinc finger protein n=1 Tax=Aromatoleum bremense TaxID=76115 RepID=A0ABX1NYK4_9RHOO|nr:type II toxin-antitoxin system MqsA family antitoxin [Aromatoleum bremense]NMG16651.1 YgiT-type zinc finger protein [Aromatoleum bremense]QTQ33516.1 Antitoxin MqsA family protein [Aromatoleum bremense]
MENQLQHRGECCPACGEGLLHARVETQVVEYGGQTGEIPLHYTVCDTCGSELAGPADALANKRAMIAFRKQVDGLLAGVEIRVFRQRYKLKQETAAALFGGGKIGFSRYENDDVAQSAAMDSLLRLCAASPGNVLTLAKQKQIALSAETVAAIKDHCRDQLMTIAPAVQKMLDRELAAQRKQASVNAANDRATRAEGNVNQTVELSRWSKAA